MPHDGKSVGPQQQRKSPREPHDAAVAPMQAANGGEQALCMALLLCNAMCQVLPAGRSQPAGVRLALGFTVQEKMLHC